MEEVDADFLLAKSIQEEFDRDFLEISSDDDCLLVQVSSDHLLAQSLQEKFNNEANITLSDDDCVAITAPDSPRTQMKVESNHVIDSCDDDDDDYTNTTGNGTAFTLFIEELQTHVDPEENFDWKFIEVKPDIKAMFEKFDQRFFQSKLKKLKVIWSRTMGECTNRNFNDDANVYTICLNEKLLVLRPRIDLISVLLHEMIHAYLKMAGVVEANNGHGANFRKIMFYLNNKIMTNIAFNHKFSIPSSEYKSQWWRCTGVCSNYRPFFGIVRSPEGLPGLHNEWWECHQDNCGGTFFKVFEMNGKVGINTVTKYAVNVQYRIPKRELLQGRFKTKIKPKESVDLTSDTPIVAIHTNVETCKLDDEPSMAGANVDVANKFIEEFNRGVALTRDAYDLSCPVCLEKIKRKLFLSHIDGCKGLIQSVQYPKRSGTSIVADGNNPSTSSYAIPTKRARYH